MTMKVPALSVRQPWANLIASGRKRIEYRSWATRYRGPLLICAARTAADNCRGPYGVAIVLVDLVDCRKPANDGKVQWVLKNPRRVQPVPVRGRLGVFTFEGRVALLK